jgi:MFS family permease
VGFVAASVLCGLSVSPAMLIASRLVQGSFGALMIPQGISILTATFSRAQIPRAVSAFGPAMGVSAVLGPIVAGFIIDADIAGLTWRPIFLINIILGSVGALKYLPRDRPSSGVVIDGLGAGLLGASMLGLMYGLIQGSTAGWTLAPILSIVIGDRHPVHATHQPSRRDRRHLGGGLGCVGELTCRAVTERKTGSLLSGHLGYSLLVRVCRNIVAWLPLVARALAAGFHDMESYSTSRQS